MTDFKFTDNQEEWLGALESGEYAQCKGTLWVEKDGQYSYCCLGLIGKLFDPDCDEMEASTRRPLPRSEGTECSTAMMDSVKLWTKKGGHGCDDEMEDLTMLNDDQGYSFAEIAAVIRENPDDYLKEGA